LVPPCLGGKILQDFLGLDRTAFSMAAGPIIYGITFALPTGRYFDETPAKPPGTGTEALNAMEEHSGLFHPPGGVL
jgi:hypothetical protein